jgi:GTPase SAR1 family protein
VFAVDDEDSWNEITKLREQIISIRGPNVPIVIVGNKIDSTDRKVPSQVTESIANFDWECGYAECSAKDNIGILTVFKQLLAQANIKYNLSPAVRRRRKSLPSYASSMPKVTSPKYYLKRHSCVLQ